MRICHLVAYRQAGFNPVAVASPTPPRPRRRRDSQLSLVHASYAELLADQTIEVLDVAVPPDAQPALIREAVRHNDHIRGILAQKPLALSVREARECVDLCRGVRRRPGRQPEMRYDQSVRAMKKLLSRGLLGEPVLATIDMRAVPHWMPWSEELRRFHFRDEHPSPRHFSILVRHAGSGSGQHAPRPATRFPHRDGINLYILEYDGGRRSNTRNLTKQE